MKKILFLLLFFPALSNAQVNLDSLLGVLNNTKEDTTKVNLLIEINEAVIHSSPSDALNYSKEAYNLAIKLDYLKGQAKAMNEIAVAYYFMGNVDTSIIIFNKCVELRMRINDVSGMAELLNNIGYIFINKGQTDSAFVYFKKSAKIRLDLKLYEKLATTYLNIGGAYYTVGIHDSAEHYYNLSLKYIDESMSGTLYTNISTLYAEKGNMKKSFEYQYKALRVREKHQDYIGVVESWKSIGVSYNSINEHSKAINCIRKGLQIAKEVDLPKDVGELHYRLGDVYFNMNSLDSALFYYNEALPYLRKMNSEAYAGCLSSIGDIYFEKGKYQKSNEYEQEAIQILREGNYLDDLMTSLRRIGENHNKMGQNAVAHKYFLEAYELSKTFDSNPTWVLYNLSISHNKRGENKKAFELLKQFIELRDSLDDDSRAKEIFKQEAKYNYENQKALDDAEYDKQWALEQEAKAKQRIITYATAGGLGLVAIFLVFAMNRLKVTRKQKAVIEVQKTVVEQQKEVVELAHQETQEQKEIIEVAHKEITDSINYAERIQRSFLATEELLNEYLDDYFVFFQPKEAVSGDFYWAGKLPNNNFAMVNADSTGHGVPGAIMSILNISSIEKAVEKGLTNPSAIFNDTRNTIIERLKKDGSAEGGKDGMDASIIVFDKENNKFTYTAAQNPIWIIRNKEVIQIKPEKMPIGKHDNDATPFIGGEFEIQKGDIVYTLTDGYQDQFGGPKGKKFMIKKMREYILSISHLPMQEQHQAIKDTFNSWKGDLEQIDDVCVIGVKI